MAKAKPSGWKESLDKFISEGKNYTESNALLIKEYGATGNVSSKTFWSHKQKNNPEEERERVLTSLPKKDKSEKRPAWNKGKQKSADESDLAKLINKGIFCVIPCPSNKLEEKHVQEINVGGAIIGSVTYYFPDINLDHPLILLTTRTIVLIIKVRALCYTIKEKVQETVSDLKDKLTGIKSGWESPVENAGSQHLEGHTIK